MVAPHIKNKADVRVTSRPHENKIRSMRASAPHTITMIIVILIIITIILIIIMIITMIMIMIMTIIAVSCDGCSEAEVARTSTEIKQRDHRAENPISQVSAQLQTQIHLQQITFNAFAIHVSADYATYSVSRLTIYNIGKSTRYKYSSILG